MQKNNFLSFTLEKNVILEEIGILSPTWKISVNLLDGKYVRYSMFKK